MKVPSSGPRVKWAASLALSRCVSHRLAKSVFGAEVAVAAIRVGREGGLTPLRAYLAIWQTWQTRRTTLPSWAGWCRRGSTVTIRGARRADAAPAAGPRVRKLRRRRRMLHRCAAARPPRSGPNGAPKPALRRRRTRPARTPPRPRRRKLSPALSAAPSRRRSGGRCGSVMAAAAATWTGAAVGAAAPGTCCRSITFCRMLLAAGRNPAIFVSCAPRITATGTSGTLPPAGMNDDGPVASRGER